MREQEEQLAEWATTGNQKAAMLRVLTMPMPAKTILSRAKKYSPCMTMRDLILLLHAALEKGVISCLTPTRTWGKIYYPTDLGRKVLKIAFGMNLPVLPSVDWETFGYLRSGETRSRVFMQVLFSDGRPRRATDIKHALKGSCGVTLNQTSRALAELELAGLISVCGISSRSSRLYSFTEKGRKLFDMMQYFWALDPFSLSIRGEG